MTPLRTFVVDDEPLALSRLSHALRDMTDVELVGASTSSRTSLDQIRELRPDILFLDIAMPGLDGFDVVERLDPDCAPAVIFVTAHDEHAVRAFTVSAVDYLLKPVTPDRLRGSVDRARAILAARVAEEHMLELRATIAKLRRSEREDDAVFWVHRHRKLVRISASTVEWIEAEGDYVRLHATDGEGIMRLTLAGIEAQLDPILFIRVHRSAICRRSAIISLRRKATGALRLTLASGEEISVGRRYAAGIKDLLRRMAT